MSSFYSLVRLTIWGREKSGKGLLPPGTYGAGRSEKGKAVHKGRNTGLAEATIKDAGGRIIAKGMTTHFCKRDSNKELDI